MLTYLNLRLKIGLIISGIMCAVFGLMSVGLSVYTCAGSLVPYENVRQMNRIYNSELTDGVIVTGRTYKPVGKYSADFGNGDRSYVIMAFDTFEHIQNNRDKTKEVFVSVDIEAAGGYSDEWWDTQIKNELSYIKYGYHKQIDTFDVECRLKSIPGDYSMSNIYTKCGGNIPTRCVIPYYAEPYQINTDAVHKKVDVFPIWYGLGFFAVSAVMFFIHFIRFGKKTY